MILEKVIMSSTRTKIEKVLTNETNFRITVNFYKALEQLALKQKTMIDLEFIDPKYEKLRIRDESFKTAPLTSVKVWDVGRVPQ